MTSPASSPAEAERIELNGGWCFVHREIGLFALVDPDGRMQPGIWGRDDARAFAAAQRPAAPVDRETLATILRDNFGQPYLAMADAILAHLSAQPRVAVPMVPVSLLKEVVEQGLIYWEPQTARGLMAKAEMRRRCELAIAEASHPTTDAGIAER